MKYEHLTYLKKYLFTRILFALLFSTISSLYFIVLNELRFNFLLVPIVSFTVSYYISKALIFSCNKYIKMIIFVEIILIIFLLFLIFFCKF